MRIPPVVMQTYLIDNGIKDLPPEQIAWYSKFTVNKADAGIVRIINIETCEVEHIVCESSR